MPNKTSNYQLNQWEPEDNFQRTDFNEDNAKIDAAIMAAKTEAAEALEKYKTATNATLGTIPRIVTGTYVGAGSNSPQSISVGFRPKVVIAWGNHSDVQKSDLPLYSAMAVEGQNYTRALSITDTGFTAMSYYSSSSGLYYPNLNDGGLTYLYLAIG